MRDCVMCGIRSSLLKFQGGTLCHSRNIGASCVYGSKSRIDTETIENKFLLLNYSPVYTVSLTGIPINEGINS